MDLRENWFVLSAIAVIFLASGILVGASALGGNPGTAETVIDRYPLELSMTGLKRYDTKNVAPAEAPEVDIEIRKDSMTTGAVNVWIKTSNFRFAPREISRNHRLGEGHAHVYVDGVEISRAYGPWHHIPRLKLGNHSITVTLNTNDHQNYAVNGETVKDTEYIVIGR